jgi:hypothetical protein
MGSIRRIWFFLCKTQGPYMRAFSHGASRTRTGDFLGCDPGEDLCNRLPAFVVSLNYVASGAARFAIVCAPLLWLVDQTLTTQRPRPPTLRSTGSGRRPDLELDPRPRVTTTRTASSKFGGLILSDPWREDRFSAGRSFFCLGLQAWLERLWPRRCSPSARRA